MKWTIEPVVLAVASLFFLVSTSWFFIDSQGIYNAPDENANAVFTQTFATTGRLWMEEPLNVALHNILHPRSVVAFAGRLAPGSFIGLPVVYGIFSAILPFIPIREMTPLLAIFAVFAWYKVIETIFHSKKIALVSVIAVFFHPAFWYWSARSMMHNVPFVSFAMIGVYFAVVRPLKKTWFDFLLSGLFIGLALFFRTFEAIWIVPIAAALLIAYHRRIDSRSIVFFTIGIVLALLPLPFLNQATYGSPIATGYTIHLPDVAGSPMDSTAAVSVNGTEAQQGSSIFFPFGFNSKSIVKNIWYYAVGFFPWLSFAAVIGWLVTLGTNVRKHKKNMSPQLVYTIIAGLVAIWLFIVYGSWIISDNPGGTTTIGVSYTRYWLPIFVLASPFVGQAVVWLSSLMSTTFTRRALGGCLMLLIVALSLRPVFFADDGLSSIRPTIQSSTQTRDQILILTESNAIIIVDWADKYLWPARRVVEPLRSEATYAAMPSLAKAAPLYYFGITFPDVDLAYLNGEKLKGLGLHIVLVKTLGQESLYRLYENR